MSTADDAPKSNFLRQIIDADLESGRHSQVVTRFPPEPNGYLHIGHAKSICLNFGLARDYGGVCHLRMDDTNPETEEAEYIAGIERDVRWLGFDWGDKLFHASDFFERMYDFAEHLVRAGKAYVDHLDADAISAYRGTLREPGRPSPHRDRSVEENLDLLRRMRAGEFADGTCVLRAKGDLASPNMKMRDPLLYRIRKADHPRTGDTWCIYPMYDYAHPLEDALEGVTHSICTLEFENNREIYDWVLEHTPAPSRPRQYEFARLNITYTVLSKRKLLQLVGDGHVAGWDDPRMPTLAGMRRRGYTPEAIRTFCDAVGVTKTNSRVDMERLEGCLRDDLNHRAPRLMAVLDPIEVELVDRPEGEVTPLDAASFPDDVGKPGSRTVPLGRRVLIERADFSEAPPKGWRRLSPGGAVRLRYGPVVRCVDVVKDAEGIITGLRCEVDDEARANGTLHWVPAEAAVRAEVRLYDRLFSVERPDQDPAGRDPLTFLNPTSLVVVQDARLEPAAALLPPGTHVQFERNGYYVTDAVDSRADALVFNRAVTLRDSWARRTETTEDTPSPAVEKKLDTRPQKRTRAQVRDEARARDPALAARLRRYRDVLRLDESNADVLTGDRATGDLFEAALATYADVPSVTRWVVNEVLAAAKDAPVDTLPLTGEALGALARMVDENVLSNSAAKEVFAELVERGGDPAEITKRRGLRQVSDADAIETVIAEVLAAHPAELARYREGNAGLLGFFMGQVMRKSGGKANPGLTRGLLQKALAG